MILRVIQESLSISKIKDVRQVDWSKPYTFLSMLDNECSLVCPSHSVPSQAIQRQDGWRAFSFPSIEDGLGNHVLTHLSSVLAENEVNIHIVTTFQKDYILVPERCFFKAVKSLEKVGHVIDW